MTKNNSPAKPRRVLRCCQSCAASGVPLGRTYGLCGTCWSDPAIRKSYTIRDLATAPEPCPHAPGTAGKIAWMAARAAEGLSIFAPADATFDGVVGAVQPSRQPEVMGMPKARARGIEKLRNRWRVRPMVAKKKIDMGTFRTFAEAEAVARKFWQERQGLFWEMGGQYRYCKLRRAMVRQKREIRKRSRPHGPTLWEEEMPLLRLLSMAG